MAYDDEEEPPEAPKRRRLRRRRGVLSVLLAAVCYGSSALLAVSSDALQYTNRNGALYSLLSSRRSAGQFRVKSHGRLLNATACHYMFKEDDENVPRSGIFTSPNFVEQTRRRHQASAYDAYYGADVRWPPLISCRYTFAPGRDSYVNLKFPVMNVSRGAFDDSCPERACLSIYDGRRVWLLGNASSVPLAARFGGFNSSATTVVTLHFRDDADRRLVGHGFKGIYSFRDGPAPDSAPLCSPRSTSLLLSALLVSLFLSRQIV